MNPSVPPPFYKHIHHLFISSPSYHSSGSNGLGALKKILVQSALKVLNRLGRGISCNEGECMCVCVSV